MRLAFFVFKAENFKTEKFPPHLCCDGNHSIQFAHSAPFRLDLTVCILRRRDTNRIDSRDGKTHRRAMTLDLQIILASVEQRGSAGQPELELTPVCENPSLRSRTGRYYIMSGWREYAGGLSISTTYERLYTTLSRRISLLLSTPLRCIPRSAEAAWMDTVKPAPHRTSG